MIKSAIYYGNSIIAEKACVKMFEGLPYSVIKKSFRLKDVKVNNNRVLANDTVCDGDKIDIYYSAKDIPTLKIVYKDDKIIVIDKPQGMASVGEGSAETRLSEQLKRKVLPIHRLDTNTAGLLLFAFDEKVEERLVQAFKEREINKYYLARVIGKPSKNEGVFKDYLFKDANKSKVKIVKTQRGNAVEVLTAYRLLETEGGTSLLEILLLTGRTHQIRAHLAYHGLPILGDGKYGDFEANKKRGVEKQQLVAYKIEFLVPRTDSIIGYLNGKVIER